MPPAIGYPVPVREDGTLPLPLVASLKVRGLTLTQVENVIRKAYTVDQRILGAGKDRIFVTLIRERRYQVVVMRQEPSLGGQVGSALGWAAWPLPKPAVSLWNCRPTKTMFCMRWPKRADCLVKAQNEVKILRGSLADARQRRVRPAVLRVPPRGSVPLLSAAARRSDGHPHPVAFAAGADSDL